MRTILENFKTYSPSQIVEVPQLFFVFFQVFKEVWIGSDVVGLRRAIRKFGVERFKKNCILATEGFDWVMRKMYSGASNPGNGSVSAGAAVVNKKPEKRMSHVPAYSSKLEQ